MPGCGGSAKRLALCRGCDLIFVKCRPAQSELLFYGQGSSHVFGLLLARLSAHRSRAESRCPDESIGNRNWRHDSIHELVDRPNAIVNVLGTTLLRRLF